MSGLLDPARRRNAGRSRLRGAASRILPGGRRACGFLPLVCPPPARLPRSSRSPLKPRTDRPRAVPRREPPARALPATPGPSPLRMRRIHVSLQAFGPRGLRRRPARRASRRGSGGGIGRLDHGRRHRARRQADGGRPRPAAQRHLRIQGRDHERPRRHLSLLQRSLQSLRAARRGAGFQAGPPEPGSPDVHPPGGPDPARAARGDRVGERDQRAHGRPARNRHDHLPHRHRQVVHPARPGRGPDAGHGRDRDLDPRFRARRERPLPLSGRAQPERIRHRRADDRGSDGRDVLELDRSVDRPVDGGDLRKRPGGVRREGRRRHQHDDEVRPRLPVQGKRDRQLRDLRHVPGRGLAGRRHAVLRRTSPP